MFESRYQAARLKGRFKAAYAVDGWLCTHAGVALGVADIVPTDVIIAGPQEIADWLNEEFLREFKLPVDMTCDGRRPRYGVGPLFQIPRCRAGSDPYGGIFWFDCMGEMTDPSPLVGRQVFGHTPVPYPEVGSTWLNINTFEDGLWIFDTEENQLVEIYGGEIIPVGGS